MMTKWQAIRQRHEQQKASDPVQAHKDRAYLLRAEEWLQHKRGCLPIMVGRGGSTKCTCGLDDYLEGEQ